MFAYDAVTYPSQPLQQAHPDRLATIGTLLGLQPAPVEKCRYLEIGAGDGVHLIDCALTLPGSQFVGVDLSEVAIQRGQRMIERLGLSNVQLYHADLMDWTPPDGPYDYVMAHGFYSWVPSVVRDRLMEIVRQHLAPQGVAYISYNTLPGCHIRRMLWDMMKFHTRNVPDPVERLEQSVIFMQFLKAGQPPSTEEDNFAQMLRHEVEKLTNRHEKAVLYHDDLSEINDPVYVRDFAAHAARHGLRFLSEADYFETQSSIYPKDVATVLKTLASQDEVLKEQYLDFLKCRRFRQTLLCHVEVSPEYQPSSDLVRGFSIASLAKPVSSIPNLAPGAVETFSAPRGGGMKVDLPLAKAAMVHLASTAPIPISYDELVAAAQRKLDGSTVPDADTEESLRHILLGAYSAGIITFHTHIPKCARTAGEKPVASPIALMQIADGQEVISTLLHTPVLLDTPVVRQLLQLLDGTRTRSMLAKELAKLVTPTPEAEKDPAGYSAGLKKSVEEFLQTAAQRGLLLE